jgi:hypothetical protein
MEILMGLWKMMWFFGTIFGVLIVAAIAEAIYGKK